MAGRGVTLSQAWVKRRAASASEPVIADTTRLTQVLVNLLQQRGQVQPQRGQVRVECEPLPGQRFAMRVIDTGPA